MKNGRFEFPQHIDKTRMVGMLEVDEAAFVVVGVGFMLLVGFALAWNVALAMVSGVIIGFSGAFFIKGVKAKFPNGYIFHLLYAKGIVHPMKDNPKVRVSHIRYFENKIKIIPDGYITTFVE